MTTLLETNLPLRGRRQGKVRDIYDLPPSGGDQPIPRLLIVASDRLSAFDVVLPTPIPDKGRLLTRLSTHWFEFVKNKGLSEHHLLSTDPSEIPGLNSDQRESLVGRCMIARACEVVPIECVVRGYLDGSGWVDYQQTGSVCSVELPTGLQRGDQLPEPIFTPATKAEIGLHDENIDFDRACEVAGRETMEYLRETALAIYNAGHAYAKTRGLILADTKFEFGVPLDGDGKPMSTKPILIDEVLTSDSSRYWDAKAWKPGGPQPSFDKQFVRDYLNELVSQGKWDKTAPGPELPEHIAQGTRDRYCAVVDLLFPGE